MTVRRPSPDAVADRLPGAPPPLIADDRLEAALVTAARERRPLTYRVLLGFLGLRHGPGNVGRLCRVLGRIDRARASAGLPELACLVVRQTDAMPGEGYWADDPDKDAAARALLIRERQEGAFAWAATARQGRGSRRIRAADAVPDRRDPARHPPAREPE